MRLLLDTHVALWALGGSPRLPARAEALVADEGNAIAVSVAALWEVAVKHAKNPKQMPVTAAEAEDKMSKAGFKLLPIEVEHALAVESLPAIHADPFDRIMIAQAVVEPMRLVTADKIVAEYSDAIILV